MAELKRLDKEQTVKGPGKCNDAKCCCHCFKFEMDSCVFKFLILQTKHCREEEESDDKEINRESMWKKSDVQAEGSRQRKNDGEKGTGCRSPLYIKPLSSLLSLAFQNSDVPNHWYRIFALAYLCC